MFNNFEEEWARLLFNPLSARIFTDFWLKLLEGRVLHKGAWVATLLSTLLGVQDYKRVKFPGRDISSLAAKGLRKNYIFLISENHLNSLISAQKKLKPKNKNFLFILFKNGKNLFLFCDQKSNKMLLKQTNSIRGIVMFKPNHVLCCFML